MDDATHERWSPVVDVVDFTGLYAISDQGRLRGLKSGVIHKPSYSNSGGYPLVILTKDGQRYGRYIHRLVAAAFLRPCPEGMEVRHKKPDPRNAAASNLEYGTSGDNKRDQVRDGTHPEASRTHCDNGHEFTPKNTRMVYWPDGTFRQRWCRACANDRTKERRRNLAATAPPCTHESGCTEPQWAKKLCSTHYAQQWRESRKKAS